MEKFFWDIFKKSGNVEAFLAYKEFEKHKVDKGLVISQIKNEME